jgi:hypothetical protein
MPEIEIDDEVYAALQKHARAFVDTPNSTLRRILGVDPARGGTPARRSRDRSKAPKADLRELIDAGLLRNGEELVLIDYRGNTVPKVRATVSGSLLHFKGEHHSMSFLARERLKDLGFTSDYVRGPAHWATKDGVTVKDLWDQFLEKRKKSAER